MNHRKKHYYISAPLAGSASGEADTAMVGHPSAGGANSSKILDSVEISHNLAGLAANLEKSGAPRVLLVARGEEAERGILACKSVGLDVGVVFTEDMADEAYLGDADHAVCIGEVFSENLFNNSYAVLQAAEECNALAILLVESTLSHVDSFFSIAASKGMKVYRAFSSAVLDSGWVECSVKLVQSEAFWKKCPHCGLSFSATSLAANHFICPACGGYFRMSSVERVRDLFDADSAVEWFRHLPQPDPLGFPDYPEKLAAAQEKTGLDEGVRCGAVSIAGIRCAGCVMDSQFFLGSMGAVVGEKITRTVERATNEGLPLIIFTASGGARMQEGLVSLMQMAKISGALSRHGDAGLPYISVVTDPTTGGVTASFAMQGDIVLAEPRALIGFAGRRVIQGTIKQSLPEDFQTAEFALEHGLIDAIVPRESMRETLAHLLAIHEASSSRCTMENGEDISYEAISENLASDPEAHNALQYGIMPQIKKALATASNRLKQVMPKPTGESGHAQSHRIRKQLASERRLEKLLYGRLDAEEGVSFEKAMEAASFEKAADVAFERSTSRVALKKEGLTAARIDAAVAVESAPNPAWESVQLARNTHRPTARYYIDEIVDGFIELHGDRAFGDDGALVCGLGWIGNQPVTIIAQEKGANLKERLARNFGSANPEGYRKSLRLMKQAEKFERPVICLVDTQGAFCGVEAEERGQGNAIADNLIALSGLRVPVISVLIGEGGSGGALALAVSDRVAMQKHAVYSILSPEGFASILWKDRARAPEAAAVMKMRADDAYEMGIVDMVISEGEKPAHENPAAAAAFLRSYLTRALEETTVLSPSQLLEERYDRFRKF